MSKYYIFTDGVVRGAFELENIAMMLSDGRIDLSTPVSLGKDTPWQTIAERQEILSAANELRTPRTGNAASTGTETIFYCPKCNQKYKGDSSWLGRDVVCISCNEIFSATDGTPKAEENIKSEESYAASTFDWANCDGNVICPHCWQRFNSEQLLYIATHPSLMGDPVLGPTAMKRFAPTKFNALGQALDEMSLVSTDVACPRCRLKIPLSVIDEKNFYFSLVGAPSSGKSYYLATLLNNMRRTFSNNFACNLVDVDPELNRVLDSYEETIFRAAKRKEVAVLPKTQQTGDDFVNVVELDNIPVHLPKPFVYELKNLTSENNREDCNIIFYDNAGEQFEPGADNMTNPGTRHLACSDGIIFIFDPLNDALMRKHCNPDEPQLKSDEHVYDQTRLLAEMVFRIRRHRNMNTDAKCSIPLVVAVGKFDAWKDIFPREMEKIEMLERVPGKLSALWRRNNIMDVSFELREMLLKIMPELVNTAEGFFENVVFVPFSSFGCLSTQSGSGQLGVIPEQVKPLWAAEPFLWLLNENGIIESAALPEADAELEVQQIEDFMVFDHPADKHQVRLPANYSNAVLSINGMKYKLPRFSGSSSIGNDLFDTGNDKSGSDIWN